MRPLISILQCSVHGALRSVGGSLNFEPIMAIICLVLLFSPSGLRSQAAPPAEGKEPVRLTLSECKRIGIERNPEIEVSRAQVDQSEGLVIQAKSNLYPTLNLTANVVRSNKLPEFNASAPTLFPSSMPLANASGGVVPGMPSHVHMLGFPGFDFTNTREDNIYLIKLESQYPLYTGGKIKLGIKAAELNVRSADEGVRYKRNEILYNIEQAFYGVLLGQEIKKVIDDAYATMEAHYFQVKAFYNEGLASNLNVVKVEAALASIRPQQVQANNGLRLARLRLNNLLNIDLDTPVEAVGSLKYERHELALPEDLYAQAIATRPEMRSAKINQEMTSISLEVAKSNAYPTVALFANYSWDKGQEIPPNDKIWFDGWQAGAVATVPLFDGLETKGMVEEVEAQFRQVEHGKRALELGIRTQVQAAILTLRAAEERIVAEQANVEAASKNHDVAKARYAVGLATNIDVMDAQTQLMQAKGQYLTAVHDYILAWAQLQAALGMPEEKEQP